MGSGVYRFGAFRLDAAQRVLLRDGREVPLAPKTFDLLQFLVENQGRLLGKSELMSALWPDTIVEEINLAFQISTLRKAFGQEGAKWIETVPKHGYRFVAEVHLPEKAQQRAPRRRRLMRYVLPAVAVRTGALLVFAALDRSDPAGSIVPVTSFPGSEIYRTLSPDGAQMVFSWNASDGSYDLYLHAIGSDVPMRITHDPADDLSASWSPDGRSIAFLRYHSEREAGVYVLRLPGGPERQVATVRGFKSMDLLQQYGSRLAWHPDGKWLVVSEAGPTGLVLVPAEGGEKRVLLPKEESGWDEAPSFAPDGRALAFVRVHGYATSSLFRIGLTEELKPLGDPERLTDSAGWTGSPVWSPDGEAIYYLSGFRRTRLWRIRHGKHELLRDLLGRASFLSAPRVGADGRTRLAFSTRAEERNI